MGLLRSGQRPLPRSQPDDLVGTKLRIANPVRRRRTRRVPSSATAESEVSATRESEVRMTRLSACVFASILFLTATARCAEPAPALSQAQDAKLTYVTDGR